MSSFKHGDRAEAFCPRPVLVRQFSTTGDLHRNINYRLSRMSGPHLIIREWKGSVHKGRHEWRLRSSLVVGAGIPDRRGYRTECPWWLLSPRE